MDSYLLWEVIIRCVMHGGYSLNIFKYLSPPTGTAEDLSRVWIDYFGDKITAFQTQQSELIEIEVRPSFNNPNTPYRIGFSGLVGQRGNNGYNTFDCYYMRMETNGNRVKAGRKHMMGADEGDVTDSSVDTDMPNILNGFAGDFPVIFDVSGVNYFPVVTSRPDDNNVVKVASVLLGSYVWVSTMSKRKLFRQGDYLNNLTYSLNLESGNGSVGDFVGYTPPAYTFTKPAGYAGDLNFPFNGDIQGNGDYVEFSG